MDKYDKQIQELTEYPERIEDDWILGVGLFQFLDRKNLFPRAGCPIQIRKNYGIAIVKGQPDYALTEKIKNDERIPLNQNDIGPENFHIFAEYQRMVDELEGIN